MARNGSGVYSLPSNSWNPAVSNTQINETDWNSCASDLSTALTDSIASDGQTTCTGSIPFAQGINVSNGGLKSYDAGGTYSLAIKTGSIFSANRILTINPGNANRTLSIPSSATISQDYSTTGSPHFANLTLSGALTYGGVTLTAGVTGTGNMVLSGSPTFSGTPTTPALAMSGTGQITWSGGTQFIELNGSSQVQVTNNTNGVVLGINATSWSSASDESLKTDLTPIQDALAKLATLRTVMGRYKTDPDNVRRPFLIAQDVRKILPEAVTEQSDGTLVLSYTETLPLVIAAINELAAKLT